MQETWTWVKDRKNIPLGMSNDTGNLSVYLQSSLAPDQSGKLSKYQRCLDSL